MSSVVVASAEHRLAMRRFEVERWVAAAVVLLSFADAPVMAGRITVTSVVVLALAPVWLGALRRFSGALVLFVATSAALACGVFMALVAGPEREVLPIGAVDFTVAVVTLIGRIGILLWARTRLSSPTVAALAGAAMLATVPRDSALYATNPWKFGFALPMAVLLLAIAWRLGLRWVEIAVLLALSLVSATSDARSSAAILGLSVLVLVWGMTRSGDAGDAGDAGGRGRSRWLGTAIVVAALGWVVYHLVEWMILAGMLGDSTRGRTQDQLDAGGSLLLGGRPELAASLALLRDTPWGFGLGVQPTLQDVLVAKSGMASINYDPNNGYVENYMLGTGFALHSVAGDLWANLGPGGVVMCAVLVYVAFRAVLVRLMLARAGALVIFLASNAAWALAFGPLRSSLTVLSLLVGLALVPTAARQEVWDDPVESVHAG